MEEDESEAEGESDEDEDSAEESKQSEDPVDHEENRKVIANAKLRLENYTAAIEYCQAHNINPKGMDLLIKNKKRIEDTIKKMKKSKDAKNESIYLPNELSPESLFGKSPAESNKEKADLLSIVNKAISEHQKVLQSVETGDFKSKADQKQLEKDVRTQLQKQQDNKQKLEIIQVNRWWPVPEHLKTSVTYFIPKLSSKKQEAEGEKISCALVIKKQPAKGKGEYLLTCSSKSGFNESRKIAYGSKAATEEFIIPLKNLDDLKNYTVSCTRYETKSSCMCFGKSEHEVFNIQIPLKFLIRNKEKTSAYRKNDYDVFVGVTWANTMQAKGEEVQSKKTNVRADGEEFNVDVVEITNLLQPFREDNPDEFVRLKSSNTHKFKQSASINKQRTSSFKKSKSKGIKQKKTKEMVAA